jgi:hypothetical protein
MIGWRWKLLVAAFVAGAGIALASPEGAAAQNTIWADCWIGSQALPCDSPPATGWWIGPLTVIWHATGEGTPSAPTSTEPCQLGIEYPYRDTTGTSLSCTANWSNGDSNTDSFDLKVEADPPTVKAVATAQPNSNGWYSAPVNIVIEPLSSISGFGSGACNSITYSEDTAGTSVVGSCVDSAGWTAQASLPLKYDATPPTVSAARPSRPPDYDGWYTHPVSFTFKGADALSGIDHCKTVTYSGPVSGSVTGGCWDRAGNYSARTVPVSYLQVVARASGARVAPVPSLLQWKSRRHASYYNLQLYRGTHKVLSTWPSRTSLLIRPSWRFHRRRFQLKAGRYHWYVWPGYGSRAADRYGRRMVSATFTVI